MVSKESILEVLRFTNDGAKDVNGNIFRCKRNYNCVYTFCYALSPDTIEVYWMCKQCKQFFYRDFEIIEFIDLYSIYKLYKFYNSP